MMERRQPGSKAGPWLRALRWGHAERWLRGYPAMWFGELVSMVGSGLTRFALAVWIFQRTGSVTQFSLLALCTSLPAVLASPISGLLVDRWDRRRVLIWCNLVAGLGVPLVIAALLRFSTLHIWEIYVIEVISSLVTAFQWPAYFAATTALVSKQQLGRVNGLMLLANAASDVVAPILASLLLVVLGLLGILMLDFASFLFAAVTLVVVRMPAAAPASAAAAPASAAAAPASAAAAAASTAVSARVAPAVEAEVPAEVALAVEAAAGALLAPEIGSPMASPADAPLPPPEATPAPATARKAPRLEGVGDGWRFVRQRPGLLGLLTFFAIINLVFSCASVLIAPLVLSFADAKALALVLSLGSAGLFGGGLLMSITGGPRRRIHGVLGLGLLFSFAMAAGGLRPDVRLLAGSLCVFMAGLSVITGSAQAIWQLKVPLDLQGRVFAVRRMIAMSTTPLGIIAAGPLADRLFEPMMMPGGALAASAGRLIGVGKGRGIALLFIALSAMPLLASIWGYMQPRLRRLEDELPDALDADDAGAAVSVPAAGAV